MIKTCLDGLVATILFISSFAVQAEYLSWEEIALRFKKEKLNTKALSHVACFFNQHQKRVFQRKNPVNQEFLNRCYGDSTVKVERDRVFALIDYTASSTDRRMFLVDRKTGEISKMAVAHGRYNTHMFNTKLSLNKNSIKYARYFSNEFNSNAPSSGFFIAGQDYEGKFGRSVILHGLETDINDNACERAVVIHKHLMVTKSSAHILSSGCPMVSPSYLDHVATLMRGTADEEERLTKAGGVVFIYGPREASWSFGSCDGQFSFN